MTYESSEGYVCGAETVTGEVGCLLEDCVFVDISPGVYINIRLRSALEGLWRAADNSTNSRNDAASHSTLKLSMTSRCSFTEALNTLETNNLPISGDHINHSIACSQPTPFAKPTVAKGSRARNLFRTSMS